jgi:LDH2 family malate/lactate/ureidoglycolate dehydrogenase
MLAAVTAADLAADKVTAGADAPAIAIVGTYNTFTSSGQLGFYAKRMAARGVIGLCMANSPEFVAAAPGGKPIFGTNPVAVGIPTAGPPLTFDMATSAIALYGALTAKAKAEALPPGVAYGRDGGWTTDASEALEGGAIATFGGHKGAGLALIVELLAGALPGAAVLGQCESKKAAKNWGHTIIGEGLSAGCYRLAHTHPTEHPTEHPVRVPSHDRLWPCPFITPLPRTSPRSHPAVRAD